MKKIFILTLLILCTQVFSETFAVPCGNTDTDKPSQEQLLERRKAREAAFEQKLGLTEAQKIKAKELRAQGREKMKPVMDEIRAKKQEAKMVKMSRMAVQMQEEKLAVIDKELKVLEKKARAIKKQNMRDFESILTLEQRRILKQMKKDGRRNFEQHHPCPNLLQSK